MITFWDECPESDDCELVRSFLELVDSLVIDIQHLEAETIRARYELRKLYDPDGTWVTTADLLSNLNTPHYNSLAYELFKGIYYNGGDPMEFKDFTDSMVKIAEGEDDYKY